MKKIIKTILLNFLAIFLVARLVGGIVYQENYLVIFWAAFFLTLLNWLVKPVLNLLLMPINMLTLGAFRWVINVIVLFLVMIVVADFRIVSILIPGGEFGGFVVPRLSLSFFWALILVSFLIELFYNFLAWVFN
jgi:putative membrane protein